MKREPGFSAIAGVLGAALAALGCGGGGTSQPFLVSFASPTPGATVGEHVALEASVRGATATTRVSFYLGDGTPIATATGAPFRGQWDAGDVRDGKLSLVAVAEDREKRATSQIDVVLDKTRGAADLAPTVVLVYPPRDATLCGVVDLRAEASDDRGGLAVTFFVDGKALPKLTDPPFQAKWDTKAAGGGRHAILVSATDSAGNVTSDAVSVTVAEPKSGPCDNAPSARLLAPAEGAIVDGDVLVRAVAFDDVGVVKVQGFADAALLGEANAPPYELQWHAGDAAEGHHVLRVVATDTAGGSGNDQVTVTVDHTPPQVAITKPKDGDRVDGDVAIVVEASDATELAAVRASVVMSGVIVAKLGAYSAAPYAFTWAAGTAPRGQYTIVAEALDTAGHVSAAQVQVAIGSGQGTACKAERDCVSGPCVDGYCCNEACTGVCRSCALPGQEGTCQPTTGNDADSCASTCKVAGVCAKDKGTACTRTDDCLSGFCVDGVCCDTACTDDCRSCNLPGMAGTCSPVTPGGTDGACVGSRACGAGGACLTVAGRPCTDAAQCATGFCVDGVCCSGPCDGTCLTCGISNALGICTNVTRGSQDPTTCAGTGTACDGGGQCKKVQGAACTTANDCLTGFCADGVCCNSACTGVCSSCATAAFPGTCLRLTNVADPDSCATGMCDGAGRCLGKNGVTCASYADCASGYCIDGVCCPSSCSVVCQSCNVSGSAGTCSPLASADDPGTCTGTKTCDASATCRSKNGQACTGAGDCVSGFCVDGVCCDGACAGSCEACNVSGTAGTCSPLPAPHADAPSCAGATACDGARGCKKAQGQACADASECAGGFCVASACCANAACTPVYDWTRVFSGPLNAEYPVNIASTSDGGVVISGYFRSTVDFDPGPGVDNRTATGTTADAFVTKLDANGSVVWTRTFGGTGDDLPYGLKVLSDGSVIVGGQFTGTADFDPGAGVDNRSATGADAFIMKLDANGIYQWTELVAGASDSWGLDVAVAPDDSILFLGTFTGTVDFDPTPAGTDSRTGVSTPGDGFLVKLTKDGGYVWGRQLPSSYYADTLAVAPDGSPVYCGKFKGTFDFDPTAGTDSRTFTNTYVAVTKLGPDGSYKWTRIGGNNSPAAGSASTGDCGASATGDVALVGSFAAGVTFDGAPQVFSTPNSNDAFLIVYDSAGAFKWIRTWGGAGSENGGSVVAGPGNSWQVAGTFTQTVIFNPGAGTDSKTPVTASDFFLVRYSAAGAYGWVQTVPGDANSPFNALTITSSGAVVLSAGFHGTVDFDPGTGVDSRTAGGTSDVFVTRYLP